MGLRIWDALSDPYDHNQLADNWSKVDFHDHTPGRGVQIPTEGIADGAITSAKMAASIDPSGSYTMYKLVTLGSALIPASLAAGTYGLMPHYNSVPSTASNSAGAVFRFDPADFSVSGRTTMLRLTGVLETLTATAPAVNFTIQMYPVTAIAAGVLTLGASVLTSATITVPAGNTISAFTGSDTAAPAAGFYILGVVTSGVTVAGSNEFVRGVLQVRQV
jgi:hypothetical protein